MSKKDSRKKEKSENKASKKSAAVQNKDVMLNTLAELNAFCEDNIMALYPLIKDNEVDSVRDRIVNFATIANILDCVSVLVEKDVVVDFTSAIGSAASKEETAEDAE